MKNKDYFKDLNIAQKSAVEYLDGPLLIVAGAGSGKTRVLISRIAHIIDQKKGKDKQTRIIEEKIKPKAFGDLTEFPPPGAVPIKYGRPCRSNRDNRSGNRDNRSGSRKGGNRKGGKKKGKKSSGWKDSRPKNDQEPKRTSSKRRKK